jgi:hypothetical protein
MPTALMFICAIDGITGTSFLSLVVSLSVPILFSKHMELPFYCDTFFQLHFSMIIPSALS